MKRAGIVTILVHHTNSSGMQMRGSMALETAFEVILEPTRDELVRPGQVSFKTDWGTFREDDGPRLQARMWTLGEQRWIIAAAEPRRDEVDPTVTALRSLEFTTMREIGDKLGADKSTISRRIKRAVAREDLQEGEAEALLRKARNLQASATLLQKAS